MSEGRFSVILTRTEAWWQPKLALLLAHCYLMFMIVEADPLDGLKFAALFVITSIGFGFFGHLTNDWSDRNSDAFQNKANMLSNSSIQERWLYLFGSLVVALMPWLIFPTNATIQALLVIEILLFILYAFKPVRLKERGFAGLVADALYAFVIPTCIVFKTGELYFSYNFNNSFYIIIVVWMLSSGLFNILLHQVTDLESDLAADQQTFVSKIGKQKAITLAKSVLLPAHLFAFLTFSVYVALNHSWYYAAVPAVPVLVSVCKWARMLQQRSRFTALGLQDLNMHYHLYLPQWNLALLLVADLWWGLLAVFHGVVFVVPNPSRHQIWNVSGRWLIHSIKSVVIAPFQLTSLIFNWSLYYFRKWILNWPEERNWGRHYPKRLQDLHLEERGTIAIFNQNFNKYSETFVQGQLHALDYRKLYFYGHPIPITENRLGNLVSHNEYVRRARYGWLDIMDGSKRQFEEKLLSDCLIENRVDLMLVHFGTVGARLTKVAAQTGIPMIVVFHGYDVWNRTEVSSHLEQYQELFNEAAHIVGVSNDICLKLKELGCPEQKLSYLPAFVSPFFFEPQKRIEPEVPTFLFVGRFSLTKAPQLVLEAFRRVVQQMPECKLVMIGADDGDKLFEACVASAKALGIEGQVEFKGALGPEEIIHEMLHSTVFVQHSITTPLLGDKEGTPVGIMEAMFLGLPIVATRHGGIAEMIEHGQSGILVEEYDIGSMAERMMELANDSELRAKIGNGAAEGIRSKPEVMSNTELFSNLIDKHKLKR